MDGIDGGLGMDGIDGGLGIAGEAMTEGAGGFRLTGAAVGVPLGTGTGLGGRLIMAVSRGLEATGVPSRRAGRTILTVSFFGSAIVSSEWVKGNLLNELESSQISAQMSTTPRTIVAQRPQPGNFSCQHRGAETEFRFCQHSNYVQHDTDRRPVGRRRKRKDH
jgi:hypothetical protein